MVELCRNSNARVLLTSAQVIFVLFFTKLDSKAVLDQQKDVSLFLRQDASLCCAAFNLSLSRLKIETRLFVDQGLPQ